VTAAGYDIDQWANLFVATAGAAAALTGLLFVAISINLTRIVEIPRLPGRAGATLGVLVALLITSCFALAPDQSNTALGIEFCVVGALVAVQAVVALGRHRQDVDTRLHAAYQLVVALIPGIALTMGGVSLAAGVGGGLFWTLAGVVTGFAVGVLNAWVLLVEINR
jgi:modulator of FtsH protease